MPGITGTTMPARPTSEQDGDDDFGGAHGASLPQPAGRKRRRPPTGGRGPSSGLVGVAQSSLVASAGAACGSSLCVSSCTLAAIVAELVSVLTGVVGTEEQFTAGLELDTQVGLGTATVAAVTRRQGGRLGGNGGSHIGLFSLHRCLAQRSHRVKDSRRVRLGVGRAPVNH